MLESRDSGDKQAQGRWNRVICIIIGCASSLGVHHLLGVQYAFVVDLSLAIDIRHVETETATGESSLAEEGWWHGTSFGARVYDTRGHA